MKRSTLIFSLIICVVGIVVGLLITRLFGSHAVGEAVSFQTPLPNTATAIPTASPAVTASATGAEPTSAPTQVAATATRSSAATNTPSARTRTSQPTATRAITATPAFGETSVYVVKTGDTLKSIANEHAVSVEAILALNTISNPDSLTVGQKIRLPRAP